MQAARTLVKSPPELWAELSDAASLARHLGEFGEIRIVRTEPEAVVEWEGDRASGSVRLEPAGWGTRVTLTAEAVAAEAPAPESSPPPTPEAPPRTRRGFFARLFRRRPRPAPAPEASRAELCRVRQPETDKVDTAPRDEEPPAPPAEQPDVDAAAVLDQALDALGAAHHRPFSR